MISLAPAMPAGTLAPAYFPFPDLDDIRLATGPALCTSPPTTRLRLRPTASRKQTSREPGEPLAARLGQVDFTTLAVYIEPDRFRAF